MEWLLGITGYVLVLCLYEEYMDAQMLLVCVVNLEVQMYFLPLMLNILYT